MLYYKGQIPETGKDFVNVVMKEGMNDDLAIRSLSLTIIPDPPEGTMLTIFTLSVYNIKHY